MVTLPRYMLYRRELIDMVQSKELILHGATYIIFSDGKVIGPSGKVLKQRKDKDGYLYFLCGTGSKKHFFTHRAVALCFVPNPDPAIKTEVDHKDNNRANPSADNLQWLSHAENVKKAAENGSYSGERNSHAILNRYEAIFIKEACRNKISRKVLSQAFGVTGYAISDLFRGKTWKMLA